MRRRNKPNYLQKAFVSWAMIALALGPSSYAFAAGGAGTTTTGSISITQAISHPASAYQVFDGDVDEDGSVADIRWGSGVDAVGLMAELTQTPGFEDCDTARDVAERLSVAAGGADTALAKRFAEVVSRHLNADGAIPFDDTETPLASNLDDGWYVVASDYGTEPEKGAALLFPGLITVGAGTSSVTPKESAPALVKEVREDSTGAWQSYADFEIGQSFQQRLVATIGDADLSYFSSYYLGFTDTLSAGLVLDEDSVAVTIDGEAATSLFTIVYEDHMLSVEAEDILGEIDAGSQIIVTYTVRLNESAETGGAGNDNSAALSYSSDPRSVAEGTPAGTNVTPEDETLAYTYGLKITKTDEADGHALEGAKFSLRRAADGKYAILASEGGGSVDAATNNNEGNQRVVVLGWADTVDEGGFVTTGADGTASIVGLDAGDDYVLNEAVAPDGYDLNSSDIPFVITANAANDVQLSSLTISSSGGSAAEGNVAEGMVGVGISNVKAPILPTTGLGGIVTSVALGSGLVALGATVVARQSSRRSRA